MNDAVQKVIGDMIKTILILAANPKEMPRIRSNEEIRDIEEGLQRARLREMFTLYQAQAVRHRDVRRAMLSYKPQIVHFSGHGAGDQGIILENDLGQSSVVTAEALAELFKLFNGIECVLLNACYSEVQAEAIAKHVDYVVGISQEIGDEAAIEFSIAFYDALGAGEPIEFAYKLGCNAIRMAGFPDHMTPILKVRLKTDDTNGRNDNQGRKMYHMTTLRILLVEDEGHWPDILRRRIDHISQEFNFVDIRYIKDYRSAVIALEKEGPWHLLITDIGLGVYGHKEKLGMELAKDAHDLNIPTLVVSGTPLESKDIRDLLKEIGVVDFFSKHQFDRREFERHVNHILAQASKSLNKGALE